jgi:hypothetical protein
MRVLLLFNADSAPDLVLFNYNSGSCLFANQLTSVTSTQMSGTFNQTGVRERHVCKFTTCACLTRTCHRIVWQIMSRRGQQRLLPSCSTFASCDRHRLSVGAESMFSVRIAVLLHLRLRSCRKRRRMSGRWGNLSELSSNNDHERTCACERLRNVSSE